jgi:hypothetical protein
MNRLLFMAGVLVLTYRANADNPNRNFQVSFSGCREYVAFGPISYAAARSALPRGFSAASTSGSGGIVVRTRPVALSSRRIEPRPATAHYGSIFAAGWDRDINNYTLLYATTSERQRTLRKTGLPVIYNPDLSAEEAAVLPGNVYIAVFGDDVQPYFMTGTVTNPSGPNFPFLANWWYLSKVGTLKMSTNIPSIAFGAAGFTLNTSSSSPLGILIGGFMDPNFPFYNVRGMFASGLMTVTTAR